MNRSAIFAAHLDQLEPALAWARFAAPAWVRADIIDFGLTELVSNAIVHGSDEDGSRVRPVFGSQFLLSVAGTDELCSFTVTWSHRACPIEARAPHVADVWDTSGRGLLIATSMFDRLSWRDDGLSITAEVHRRTSRISDLSSPRP
jgi:anti-sigma regulatory factor (Ser/Thr protein kinase)